MNSSFKDTVAVPAQSLNIFLIGPMGAGKTTVGLLLAKKTRREFVDSDAVLQERTGVPISEIFEREGEQGFRWRERKLIAELVHRSSIVLATGGGAVLDANNRRLLAAHGTVIYLHASISTQLHRLHADRTRPLLRNQDSEEVLTRLFAERAPLYQELCDHRVDMDGLPAWKACDCIVAWLDQAFGPL